MTNELITLQETKIGLQMPETMTQDEWQGYLPRFEMAIDRFRWCFGDYIAFGEDKFGEEFVYAKVQALTGYTKEAVRNIVWVAKSISFVARATELSWSHHRCVAHLESKDQIKWLRLAKENDLTVFELKHSINNGKVMRLKDIERASGKDSGVTTIEGVNLWFNRWRKRVEEDHPFETWDATRLELLKSQLMPMAQFYVKVDNLLKQRKIT